MCRHKKALKGTPGTPTDPQLSTGDEKQDEQQEKEDDQAMEQADDDEAAADKAAAAEDAKDFAAALKADDGGPAAKSIRTKRSKRTFKDHSRNRPESCKR